MPLFAKTFHHTDADNLIKNLCWAFRLTWSTHKLLVLGVVAITFIQGLLPAGLALAARGLINTITAIVNSGNDDTHTMLSWLAFGFGLTLVFALSDATNKLFTLRLEDELNLRITSDILDHAANLDLAQFETPHLRDMMDRAHQNTGQNFSQFVAKALTAVTCSVQSMSLIGILVIIEPMIALFFLPLVLPYLQFQWRLAKTHYHLEYSRATKRRWSRYFVGQMTDEQLIPEVKLLGLAPLLKQQFHALMQEFRDQDRKLYTRQFIIDLAFVCLSVTAAYLAFTRVAFRALEGGLTIGDVAIYGAAATRLRETVQNTIMATVTTLKQTLFISNLVEFFQIQSQFTPAGNKILPANHGEIVLENVTFSYPGTEKPVLIDVSFRIKPGETVALVGANGSGKTTLVKLIARLYDLDQGYILFDGHRLDTLSLDDLHRQISFVFQNFGRYEATVADNIAYGNWRSLRHDRERIEKVAQMAGAHDMIKALPRGYDTRLGRKFGELTLSGGQWQQIALARAFSREATLLILDEPTSNLDTDSEYRLFSRFKTLAHGRTTILISHRFSTVNMADRIFVMDKGQIVEHGTHQELIAQRGLYAKLYTLHLDSLSKMS